ncbi:hypothetical protein SGPA1_11335 [Streptomyces misionensis JCM 4497]
MHRRSRPGAARRRGLLQRPVQLPQQDVSRAPMGPATRPAGRAVEPVQGQERAGRGHRHRGGHQEPPAGPRRGRVERGEPAAGQERQGTEDRPRQGGRHDRHRRARHPGGGHHRRPPPARNGIRRPRARGDHHPDQAERRGRRRHRADPRRGDRARDPGEGPGHQHLPGHRERRAAGRRPQTGGRRRPPAPDRGGRLRGQRRPRRQRQAHLPRVLPGRPRGRRLGPQQRARGLLPVRRLRGRGRPRRRHDLHGAQGRPLLRQRHQLLRPVRRRGRRAHQGQAPRLDGPRGHRPDRTDRGALGRRPRPPGRLGRGRPRPRPDGRRPPHREAHPPGGPHPGQGPDPGPPGARRDGGRTQRPPGDLRRRGRGRVGGRTGGDGGGDPRRAQKVGEQRGRLVRGRERHVKVADCSSPVTQVSWDCQSP